MKFEESMMLYGSNEESKLQQMPKQSANKRTATAAHIYENRMSSLNRNVESFFRENEDSSYAM